MHLLIAYLLTYTNTCTYYICRQDQDSLLNTSAYNKSTTTKRSRFPLQYFSHGLCGYKRKQQDTIHVHYMWLEICGKSCPTYFQSTIVHPRSGRGFIVPEGNLIARNNNVFPTFCIYLFLVSKWHKTSSKEIGLPSLCYWTALTSTPSNTLDRMNLDC